MFNEIESNNLESVKTNWKKRNIPNLSTKVLSKKPKKIFPKKMTKKG